VPRNGRGVPIEERAAALLTQRWSALQHVTADPRRIAAMTRAALVLTQYEHKHIS